MADEPLGIRLRRLRERAGISMTKLADLSGISKGYLSQLESGDASRPSLDTVIALAGALNLPLSILAIGEDADYTAAEELRSLRQWERWQAWMQATSAISLARKTVEHFGAHAEGRLFEACQESLVDLSCVSRRIDEAWRAVHDQEPQP